MPLDRRGAAAGFTAYVVWGLLTMYWHELHALAPFGLIGHRIVWASLLLAIIVTRTRRWAALRAVAADGALLRRVTLAALLLSANWCIYVWAVTHNNVVETALGYFMAPLVIVAIGVVMFDEVVRPLQRVALVAAGVAVVVLTIEAGRVPIFALILAITWGCYGFIKRTVPLHPVESLAAETFVLLPLAAIVVAIIESGSDAIHTTATPLQMAMVVGTGAITVGPLLLFAFAAPRVPFTLLGPLQYAVPTINFVLGVFVYHERMTTARVLGFSCVWIALACFTTDSLRRAHEPSLRGA